jgi:hypothetical protein
LTIKLTEHAKKQMVERGVNKEQIMRAIKQGSKVKQTDGYLASYGYIVVAYKKKGDVYKIKTVMIKD